MKTFFRGDDRGSILLAAMVLIMIVSTLYLSLVPRIITTQNSSRRQKENLLKEIEEKNKAVLTRYDL